MASPSSWKPIAHWSFCVPDYAILDQEQRPIGVGLPALQPGDCSLVSSTIDTAPPDLVAKWRVFGNSSLSPMHNADWLKGYFDGQTRNLRVYSLLEAGALRGFAPFLVRDWPLKWYLGELCVGSFPLRRMRLLGGSLAFPENEAFCDLLLSRILSDGGFDALLFEEIPVDSFFWKYLNTSSLIRNSFLPYQPEAASRHPILHINGTFAEYMGKFSSKHRNTLQRKVRKLRDFSGGDMRLGRYESPADVAAFFDVAVEISRKTYQWKLHQRGLSEIDMLRERLRFASDKGWMRCYLLFCGERAVAFILGYQYEGTFFLDEIGHDPEFANYSAGTVLQLLCVEDLFNYNRARIFDLQDFSRYKDELSNDSYVQGRVLLFRPGAYARFLRTGHSLCSAVTLAASASLDRLGLKSRVKKLIRRVGGAQ